MYLACNLKFSKSLYTSQLLSSVFRLLLEIFQIVNVYDKKLYHFLAYIKGTENSAIFVFKRDHLKMLKCNKICFLFGALQTYI